MEGKKVHLTGGQGFLGTHAARALASAYEVEISDVDTLDVTDREAAALALSSSKPDVVVHLAGLTGAGASLDDPGRFYDVNLTGTVNALEACRRAGVGGFVFLSSLTVHGQTAEPVSEDSALAPRHPYAGSKAAAELVVRTYARSAGVRSVILRPTLIAGEGQAEPNAITEFAETVLGGEAIEIFGDGSHEREWLHPSDVGTAVRAAVDYTLGSPGLECESFIVSSGAGTSMAELAGLVIAAAGRGEVRLVPSTRQAFSLCTATNKAREELGWAPVIEVEEIVEGVVRRVKDAAR